MTSLNVHQSHANYRQDIDGLRAIAILSVLIFHAFPTWLPGGFIGVDIFFVISGYLISTIILESLNTGTFSFFDFYKRRIKRIFPALILVLVISYIVGWFILLGDEYKQLGLHIAAGSSFISNFILWGEAGYFDNSADTKPLLHLWSLGIEEQFYIVWPFFVWLIYRIKLNILTLTVLILIISYMFNTYIIESDSITAFYSPFSRFWELLVGGILAWYGVNKSNSYKSYLFKIDLILNKIIFNHPIKSDGNIFLNTISIVGLVLLLFGFFRINSELSFPGKWALLPVLGAVFIIMAGANCWINHKILSNKILVGFGLISFPLYLWHWPLLSFTRLYLGDTPNIPLRFALVCLSVFLAWLTYQLLERPFRYGKNSNYKITILTFLMIVIGYLGYNSYIRDGLLFRAAVKNSEQYRANLIKEERVRRSVQIRSGICNFNNQGKYKDIDAFITHWNCPSDDEKMFDSRILLFGDSHAADKAMALRLNKIDITQITGAGCPINPNFVINDKTYCRLLLELVKNNQNKFDKIFLSNNLQGNNINKENISQILKYWTINKKVFLFTPMPNFDKQMKEYIKTGEIKSAPDFTSEDEFLKIIESVELPSNIQVIKTSELICLNRKSTNEFPCAFINNKRIIMIDAGHMAVDGANIVGKNIINHSLLKDLFKKQY